MKQNKRIRKHTNQPSQHKNSPSQPMGQEQEQVQEQEQEQVQEQVQVQVQEQVQERLLLSALPDRPHRRQEAGGEGMRR